MTLRPSRRAARLLIVIAGVIAGVVRPGVAAADEASRCAALAEDAQTQRDAGHLVEAQSTLTRCARDTCPSVVKRDCMGWLEEVQKALPTILVHATDGAGHDLVEVRVIIDGSVAADRLDGRPLPLDPGVHHARFEVAGRNPVTRDLVVVEAQRNRIIEVQIDGGSPAPPPPRTALAPSPSPSPSLVPWVLVGVGAAALATFGVLELVGQSEYRDLQNGCGQTRSCSDSALSPARTKFVLAGVTLAAGVAATGVGVTLLVVRPATSTSTTSANEATAARGRLVAGLASGGGVLRFVSAF